MFRVVGSCPGRVADVNLPLNLGYATRAYFTREPNAVRIGGAGGVERPDTGHPLDFCASSFVRCDTPPFAMFHDHVF